MRWTMRIGVLTLALITSGAIAWLSKNPPRGSGFQVVDSDGSVIISDDDLESYDWSTHTMRLRPGCVYRFHELWRNEDPRKLKAIYLDGEYLYSIDYYVCIMSNLPSGPFAEFCISNDATELSIRFVSWLDRTGARTLDPDPRSDPRLFELLKCTGRLSAGD